MISKSTGGTPFITKADRGVVRTVRKGRSAVDPDSRLTEVGHILEEGDDIYNVMLNQTNIANNNNKFYCIQGPWCALCVRRCVRGVCVCAVCGADFDRKSECHLLRLAVVDRLFAGRAFPA